MVVVFKKSNEILSLELTDLDLRWSFFTQQHLQYFFTKSTEQTCSVDSCFLDLVNGLNCVCPHVYTTSNTARTNDVYNTWDSDIQLTETPCRNIKGFGQMRQYQKILK